MTDGLITSPCEPRDADSWGVFVYDEWGRWQWIADAIDTETARMIAAAFMLGIKPVRMRGE